MLRRFRVGIPSAGVGAHVRGGFQELGEAVAFGLRGLGHEAVLDDDVRWVAGETTVVLCPNALFYRDTGYALPTGEGTVLYNLEQRGTEHIGLVARLAQQPGVTLWEYSSSNFGVWDALGVPYAHAQVGYAPTLTWAASPEKDIDVLFTGTRSPRRQHVVDALARSGLRVEARWTHDNGVFGDARNALVARSRVLLNVHMFDARVFEVTRAMNALANRVAVVTEESSDDRDYAWLDGGVVRVPYEGLAEACRALLADPAGPGRVGDAGFERFSARPEAETLRAALEALPVSASPVTAPARPAPTPAARPRQDAVGGRMQRLRGLGYGLVAALPKGSPKLAELAGLYPDHATEALEGEGIVLFCAMKGPPPTRLSVYRDKERSG